MLTLHNPETTNLQIRITNLRDAFKSNKDIHLWKDYKELHCMLLGNNPCQGAICLLSDLDHNSLGEQNHLH